MNTRNFRSAIILLTGVLLAGGPLSADEAGDRARARKLEKEGNYREAWEACRKLALNPLADPRAVPEDLEEAVRCLRRLDRFGEFDEFVEQVVAAHPRNWRLLQTAARLYHQGPHYGYLIAGKFRRGSHRGGGRWVFAAARDRVRALQLMRQALPLVEKEPDRKQGFTFYLDFARMIGEGGGSGNAWRLQVLTDLDSLPEVGAPSAGDSSVLGAPVDSEGRPVFYRVPESFAAARNDGERWRWALARAAQADPQRAAIPDLTFTRFLFHQFGVQTLAGDYGALLARSADEKKEAGVFALHTLGEDETIARLAVGVRRFPLPDEFNFILRFKRLADNADNAIGWEATSTLAGIFENRQQYDKALEWWRRARKFKRKNAEERIAQITGNWGVFEPTGVLPAGRPASVDFRFRNAEKARFRVRRVDVKRLLADVRKYIGSRPDHLDWNKINANDIGRRLVYENETRYLGETVADWKLELHPRPHHFDRRITVTTPLRQAGVYLLTCELQDGNTSRIVLELADTVLVRKQLDREVLYFAADAITGAPLAGVTVEFFGYRQNWIPRTKRFRIETRRFVEKTDADGRVLLGDRQKDFGRYTWLVSASRADGRFAYHGFQGMNFIARRDREYEAVKAFTITDRPVYRPGDAVKFKLWIRRARYDLEDGSAFAGQPITFEIRDPRGKVVFQKTLTADAWGGCDGSWKLDDEALLGVYRTFVRWKDRKRNRSRGGISFRVEEYKKPEYEVTVEAPVEPVRLGETVPVKIRAKYFFGAPVTKAAVSVKILRYAHDARWFPAMPWDWFYGPGYWWFAYDYDWYPGWRRWGCARPWPWWLPTRRSPPEVVVQTTMPIGPDGTVTVRLDTRLAKELHGDTDHRYEITAEVRDESRRTIVGTGKILVGREPFKVYAWTDRGYYRVGEVGRAHFQARTLDGKGVLGKGVLRLLRVTYGMDGKPEEKEEQTWKLDTGADGCAEQAFTASRPGQYRLSYTLTDKAGHAIEGGYVFVIRGEGFDGRQFRFNQLELIPDRAEYAPGDTVRLQINTDRTGSTVLLFLRPVGGVCGPPRILRLAGKSTVVPIPVTKKDMPNFFVEALVVADGKLYNEIREIVVPPEKRILHVEVLPAAPRCKPGETGSVKIRLTDPAGAPYSGSAVVAVYDRSVEYISGGSNVPDIRAFFWKWRRRHRANTFSTFQRWFGNLLKRGELSMSPLGVFGRLVADAESCDTVACAAVAPAPYRRAPGIRKKGIMGVGAGKMEAAIAFSPSPAKMAPGLWVSDKKAEALTAPGGGGGGAEAVVQPAVRRNFADTALWIGTLQTGPDGIAGIEVPFPESLTTWEIRVWAMGRGTRVGQGRAEVVTSKNLLLRLQAPRFFVQTDEVTLSANIHNYLESGKAVRAVLELEGGCLEVLDKAARNVTVGADNEQRVDWRVRVLKEGEAVVRMKALTDEESDAVEMRFPVYVHGMDKMVPFCGVIRPEADRAAVRLRVPAERRPETTRLEVRVSPSLALAMVDALPYLVDYPYGCTEQTLNRFLPAAITRNVLSRLGVSLKTIRDKRVNLNAGELGDPKKRAAQWQRYERNPVFDEAEMSRMIKKGIEDLVAMQLADGGWGWFSGSGEHSWPHTTALVVRGLQLARENDLAVPDDVLARGVAWLKAYQEEQIRRLQNGEKDPRERPWKAGADNLDALVYRVLADADVMNPAMRDYLYRDRNRLSLYGKALYGIGLVRQGQKDKLAMVLRNLSQYVVEDRENQTAWLKLGNAGWWWNWYGDEIETQAAYLELLCAVTPKSPVAAGLVKYLLNNRKHATWWRSTRDTAFCVEAFAAYLAATGENRPTLDITIALDGTIRKRIRVTPDTLFTFDNTLVLEGDDLGAGPHDLVIVRKGAGPLYYNAFLSYFTLEDFIPKAGLEVKVERRLYRLVREDKTVATAGARGQALTQRVERYRREEIPLNATLKSGDLVEVELIVESKNDYEYIVIEDRKAAGFEPVEVRSGYNGNELGAYVEFRDEKTAFFVRRLARGRHSVSYRLRAEVPGRFSVLPAVVSAMYAPELRGNSDENKVRITD